MDERTRRGIFGCRPLSNMRRQLADWPQQRPSAASVISMKLIVVLQGSRSGSSTRWPLNNKVLSDAPRPPVAFDVHVFQSVFRKECHHNLKNVKVNATFATLPFDFQECCNDFSISRLPTPKILPL